MNVTIKFDIVLVVTSEEDIDTSELSNNLETVTKVNRFVSMTESVEVLVDIFKMYWSGRVGRVKDEIVTWIYVLAGMESLDISPDTRIELVIA